MIILVTSPFSKHTGATSFAYNITKCLQKKEFKAILTDIEPDALYEMALLGGQELGIDAESQSGSVAQMINSGSVQAEEIINFCTDIGCNYLALGKPFDTATLVKLAGIEKQAHANDTHIIIDGDVPIDDPRLVELIRKRMVDKLVFVIDQSVGCTAQIKKHLNQIYKLNEYVDEELFVISRFNDKAMTPEKICKYTGLNKDTTFETFRDCFPLTVLMSRALIKSYDKAISNKDEDIMECWNDTERIAAKLSRRR